MTNTDAPALERTVPSPKLDIGTPVEWMVDPDHPETILGVTYEFSLTGERRTVWYTRNKRRAKAVLVLSELAGS